MTDRFLVRPTAIGAWRPLGGVDGRLLLERESGHRVLREGVRSRGRHQGGTQDLLRNARERKLREGRPLKLDAEARASRTNDGK